jgi:threonine-phosphate decarboxylase
LKALGLTVYPSVANFLLFRLPASVDPDPFWQRMIVDHRIVLRSCANYEGLSAGHFRAAVRTAEENARLLNALALR